MRLLSLLALSAAAPVAQAAISAADAEAGANPVRKVVNMLQAMEKKVTMEGEKEKELYEKFMCYCKTSGGDLQASISANERKAPDVGADIEAGEAKLKQLKEELKQAQVDRSAAKAAMADATAIREKEAAAFAAEKSELDTNIAAIKSAVAALEKGMAGTFLQTNAAQVLKRLAMSKTEMLDVDRQELVAFLSNSEEYAPQSGEITGILKQMGDSMQKSLDEATADEQAAIKIFEELMAAKTKEVAALTTAIESKTTRIGELGVEIVQMKQDLSDTEAALLEDKKFLADMDKNCATKTAEWEERSKTRAEELVALADTIKVLNDDDALDLFKKTLPGASSASLVQVGTSTNSATVRAKALATIKTAQEALPRSKRASLDLIALALSGKKALSKGGFDKVVKMIDDMVALLKQEQLDDDHKKDYCQIQFDQMDDKKKGLERSVADEEAAIETATESIATLKDEIAALEESIKALDKDVAGQTEQRKAENVEYTELMASNTAAKELLGFAKNRLNKFYNPKLYKAPPKRELSEEERIMVANGGTLAPTEAPGGIAGTGVTVFAQISLHKQEKDAPPPPPATWDAYTTKSQETTGVIAMIDLLIKDLDKEMTEAATEEKNSQSEYEEFMQDSAEKRTTDSKALASKGAAKAEMEGDLEAHKEQKAASSKELMAVLKYIESLHADCDWLMQYFDVRKEARTGEIESLKQAKAVLNGADFSLLQTQASGFLGRKA